MTTISSGYHLQNTIKHAAYHFISEFTKENGKNPSGLLFNKFMVMFNRHMSDIGVDICLPHCWYRWGDEVVKFAFDDCVRFDHEDLFSTKVEWIGEEMKFSSGTKYHDEIVNFTKKYIHSYSTNENYENVVDDVYRKSPYVFQNEYRVVRENLKNAQTHFVDNYRSGMLLPLFGKAMSSFPSDFGMLTKIKDLYCKIFSSMVESDATIDELNMLSEDFWFLFCYHLRVKCNYHVSKETISIWKEKIPYETERFEWILQDLAYKYLIDTNDADISEIITKRSARVAESNKLIDMLPDDLLV